MIQSALAAIGNEPFLRLHGGRTESGSAVRARVDDVRRRLEGAGAAPGDIVAITGLAPEDTIVALLGAIDAGLVAWPLSDRDPPRVIARQLTTSRARLIVSESSRQVDAHVRDATRWRLEGAATLLATSGTTGAPKLAVHTLENHLASARTAAAATGFDIGDRWLLSLALHHVGGLAIVFRALVARASVIVPERGAPLAEAIRTAPPSHLSLVATQLARLLEVPANVDALRSCRAVLVGGGPIPEAVRDDALARGVAIHVSYGSTESTALLAASAAPDVVARPQSAGRVLADRDVRISDDGEILVGGPSLFSGYLEGGEVLDPRDPDGRFATGDLGRLDDDDVLFVLGRKDRMFVSGGENVRPEEIEVALEAVPGIERAVVVTVPHPEYGARPVAFVAVDAAEAVAASAVNRALRKALAGFKVPDAVYHLPAPMREHAKPDYVELERLAREPGGLTPL